MLPTEAQSCEGKGYLASGEEENRPCEELRGQLKMQREYSPIEHICPLCKTKPKGSEARTSLPRTQMPSTELADVSGVGHSHVGFQRGQHTFSRTVCSEAQESKPTAVIPSQPMIAIPSPLHRHFQLHWTHFPAPVQHAIKTTPADTLAITEVKPPSLIPL